MRQRRGDDKSGKTDQRHQRQNPAKSPDGLQLRHDEGAKCRSDLGARRREAAGGRSDAGRKQMRRQRERRCVRPDVHGEIEQDKAADHHGEMRFRFVRGESREHQHKHAEPHSGESRDLHPDPAEARHSP